VLTFHVITLFPESLDSYIGSSIIGRAVRDKKIKIKTYNPRDYIKAKNESGYKQVDDRPYGGGPGMVLQALPMIKTIDKAIKNSKSKPKIIFFAKTGTQFTNEYARKTAKKVTDVILICGRYEGIDERVRQIFKAEAVTVGPYVLTGGELPALIVIDTMARQLPGVLGTFASVEEERVAGSAVYTRPEVLEYQGKKFKVPKILLSGHHKKIDEWKK
jgi:tRNA (guanine37-N1)-methyltransferase